MFKDRLKNNYKELVECRDILVETLPKDYLTKQFVSIGMLSFMESAIVFTKAIPYER